MNKALDEKFEYIERKYRVIVESAHNIHEVTDGIRAQLKVLGVTFDNIADMISVYDRRGGKRPMTSESIKKAFRPIREELLHIPYGSVDLSGNWRPNEKLKRAPISQFYRNVASAHLCGFCMKAMPLCTCEVAAKGVCEPNTKTVAPIYGRINLLGDWLPNENLIMSATEQLRHNVMAGHVCINCMKMSPCCTCKKPTTDSMPSEDKNER